MSRFAFLLVALLSLTGLAAYADNSGVPPQNPLNGATSLGYQVDMTSSALRSGLTTADVVSLNQICPSPSLLSGATLASMTSSALTNGLTTFTVTPHFSVAAQSCAVLVVFSTYFDAPGPTSYPTFGTFRIQGPVTIPALTSPQVTSPSGKYMGRTTFFDGTASNIAWVYLTTAPSSGTVDLVVGKQ